MEKFHNYIEQELGLIEKSILLSQEYTKLLGNIKAKIAFKIKELPGFIKAITKG